MKIAVDDLQAIACEYLDAQVAPKADSIQKFIAFGGLYLIGFNMKNIIFHISSFIIIKFSNIS